MPDTAGGRGQVADGHARPVHVLDTSVLLADPLAFRRFGTADVVLPVVVLDELEAKRHHAELGWSARTALRSLEEFRVHHGILHEPMPVNDDGGTLRVELNHLDPGHLPESLHGTSNDHRILAVAATFAAEGRRVTLVSKDLPLRLRASMAGLTADDYAPVGDQGDHWPGFDDLTADSATIDELYSSGVADLDEARDLPCHTGLALTNGSQSVLARVHPDKRVHRVDADLELFGVRGRNAEQKVALDLMADPSIGVVSLGGAAGTGKSVMAIAAGLDSVLEQRRHRRVVVFRPLYAVGGQDLGYLPGSEQEKMSPWAAAVVDALEAVTERHVIEELLEEGLLEVLPLTHIRGRTLTDTWVIIDEAQNLERTVLLTALSRIGAESRVVLTHDVAQRDNLRVGRHDGVLTVVNDLVGHPLFAHVTLTRSERSAVASLVADLVETEPLKLE
ncbi:MAG: ribonuclease [Acidimicrobiaceae bacterium]|nr:ribonuclease [Acidimicrobiaceae bacterium]